MKSFRRLRNHSSSFYNLDPFHASFIGPNLMMRDKSNMEGVVSTPTVGPQWQTMRHYQCVIWYCYGSKSHHWAPYHVSASLCSITGFTFSCKSLKSVLLLTFSSLGIKVLRIGFLWIKTTLTWLFQRSVEHPSSSIWEMKDAASPLLSSFFRVRRNEANFHL